MADNAEAAVNDAPTLDRRQARMARKIEASRQKKESKPNKKEKAAQRERERKQAIFDAFSRFYEREFGAERWPKLLEAMQKPTRHCLMLNKYSNPADREPKLLAIRDDLVKLDFTGIPCLASASSSRFPPPSKDRTGVTDYYILDAGSVLATAALDVQPYDRVLDLCAAPGGKSLAVLQRLNGGSLTANELSPDRRRRLRQVFDDYLPATVVQETVTVMGKDGTKYYQEPEQYDKVLLDAPCSSERHLLHDEKEMEQWTPKRTVMNAKRQYALLKAAIHSVCVDGLVVYGTCSISSTENDKVIEKMLRKSKIPIQVEKMTWPIGEKTKYGWIILPDKTDGWGPLYFALIRRTGTGGEQEESDLDEDEA